MLPSLVAFVFQDSIRGAFSFTKNIINEQLYNTIIINIKKNHKCYYSITQHLKNKYSPPDLLENADKPPRFPCFNGTDGNKNINYKLSFGTYKYDNITYEITEKNIIIYAFNPAWKNQRELTNNIFYNVLWGLSIGVSAISNPRLTASGVIDITKSSKLLSKYEKIEKGLSMFELKTKINDIYKIYYSSDDIQIIYLSNGNRWKSNIKYNRHISPFQNNIIKEFLEDVDQFKNNIPDKRTLYRRGYLLSGKPGCGKSTCIEHISIKYRMPIYMINLNIHNMCDVQLINLISDIPENSLIVFEEIDRQLDSIKKNKRVNISDGGILTSIDGPQRISRGSIIIMTTNRFYNISSNLKEPLLRKGRIDKTFHFTKIPLSPYMKVVRPLLDCLPMLLWFLCIGFGAYVS